MATRLPERSQLPLAVLALLTERPVGHRELIGELPHVLGPRHRSLPHGVYPAIEALQAEGLIEGEAAGATTAYLTTPAGDVALRDRAEAQMCYAPAPSITLTSPGGARHPAESRPRRVGELLARGLPQPVTG